MKKGPSREANSPWAIQGIYRFLWKWNCYHFHMERSSVQFRAIWIHSTHSHRLYLNSILILSYKLSLCIGKSVFLAKICMQFLSPHACHMPTLITLLNLINEITISEENKIWIATLQKFFQPSVSSSITTYLPTTYQSIHPSIYPSIHPSNQLTVGSTIFFQDVIVANLPKEIPSHLFCPKLSTFLSNLFSWSVSFICC
jgi:hypothetical protein